MSSLLEIRERCKAFFIKNEMYIMPVLKFILAIVVMLVINTHIGYMSILKNPVVIFGVAFLCAFLPVNGTVAAGCVYLLGNSYAMSIEMGIVAAVLVLLMFLLYFRFGTKDAFIILLVPIAFLCKIPYVAPLLIGLMATPAAMVSMAFGIILYYFITFAATNSGLLLSTASSDIIGKITLIVESVFADKMMILMLVAFMATVLVTYLVRRLNIDYVWNTATIVGTLTNLLIILVGEFVLTTSGSIMSMILSMIVSCAIVIFVQLFVFSVDYTRTEYVQFEDDEYYYYVKAVPKMSVSTSSKRVQRINPQKR